MRRFIAALFAFALLASPAMATPPVFNGNVITKTMPTFNIKAYGAKCDGTTDDSTAIQNAINAAAAAVPTGGIILFPVGVCPAHGLLVTSDNIFFQGQGAANTGNFADTPYGVPATELKFNGTTGGTIVTYSFNAVGCSNDCWLNGGGVSNIAFLSNNGSAQIGLDLESAEGGSYRDLWFDNFSTAGLKLGKSANATEASVENDFSQIGGYNITNGGHTIWLAYGDGNKFSGVWATFKTNIPYLLGDLSSSSSNIADFNSWDRVYGFPASGATAKGIAFGCGSFSNRMTMVDTTAISYGTADGCSSSLTNVGGSTAHNNALVGYDIGDDGLANPVIDSPSTLWWSDDQGYNYGQGYANGCFAQNNFTLGQCLSRIDTSASLYIYNAGTDHMVLDDGTNKWGIYINGTNGLIINQIAGTAAKVVINNAPIKIGLSGEGVNYLYLGNNCPSSQALLLANTASSVINGIAASAAGYYCGSSWLTALDLNGNYSVKGTVTGGAHNVCSTTSGVPCETTVTCSISAGTACASAAFPAPTGAICSASPNSSDTISGGEYAPIVRSDNTVRFVAASSQTATAAANVTCL